MLKIKLISVGKFKEQYLRDAAAEYIKRLSGYCDLEQIVLEPEKLPDRPSDAVIKKALDDEGEKILKKIPDGAFTVALCIEGKKYASSDFSKLIQNNFTSLGGICFVIGGSYGLSDAVKSRAHCRMSMSDMTFPHQLAKIMLMEQIYRAFKIIEGSAYHK